MEILCPPSPSVRLKCYFYFRPSKIGPQKCNSSSSLLAWRHLWTNHTTCKPNFNPVNTMILYTHCNCIGVRTTWSQHWVVLNFTQSLISRQTKFMAMKSNNFKKGDNLLWNRLSVLNGAVELTEPNKPLTSYKIACKKLFLS